MTSSASEAAVPKFFEFESDAGIGQIRIGTFAGGPNFDNVTFGAIVPEPQSEFLLIFAMAGVILSRLIEFRCMNKLALAARPRCAAAACLTDVIE